ncbi:MAG: VapE domain-containing protein [Lachnospiraceae bacterium]|nr:virulence-associated E family protein [Acutalibacteraceae bacterium]DAY29218.1 MAG TPA: replicative DNA helicase [Caudoviricetes sp.]
MLNDRLITITTGSSRKASVWNAQNLLWSEFIDKLKTPVRSTETLAEYLNYAKSKQDELKDVGGFVGGTFNGTRRKADRVTGRDLITLDLDSIAAEQTKPVLQRLSALGCGYCVYSTRKHNAAKPRLRAIFPLDRTCTADEYEPIARKLAQLIGIEMCDPTTFQSSRLMYYPSVSSDSEYIYCTEDKPLLSTDGMLSMYGDWHDISQWPEVPNAPQIKKRLAAKQGDPTQKNGVVGAFCRTYNIYTAMDKFLPGVYLPCNTDDRFTYAEGSTTGGAVVYDDGNFIYSNHATDPAGGKLCNAFDLVRYHLYADLDDEAKDGTPTNKLPSYTRMCELAVSDSEVSALLHKERYDKATAEFADSYSSKEDNTDWMTKLSISPQSGAVAKTTDNILTILNNDPLLKDKMIYDEFSNRVLVLGALPWDFSTERRRWTDTDDAGIRHYMEKTYAITGKEKILDGCALVVKQHSIDEVKNYLMALKWDGVKRLDTVIADYLGADNTPYVRAVTRKTFVAAVARALNPGCKFDTMLTLGGPQGIGKSTFVSIMGRSWYSDSLTTFEGKEAAEMLQGVWINEIGELSGMNRSEITAVKQFLSKREDIYRVPFGRRTSAYPRRCILIGTTNDTEYLRDRTGNRRFWPIDCGVQAPSKSVFTELESVIDIIWAEAVVRYQIGEKLYLEGDVSEQATKVQEAHMETNAKEGVIREFVERKVPRDWNKRNLRQRKAYWANEFGQQDQQENLVSRDRICALEVWCEALGGDIKLMRKSDTREINEILASIRGLKKSDNPMRFMKDYGLQRGYICEVTFRNA